jgi:hypothetical protein
MSISRALPETTYLSQKRQKAQKKSVSSFGSRLRQKKKLISRPIMVDST